MALATARPADRIHVLIVLFAEMARRRPPLVREGGETAPIRAIEDLRRWLFRVRAALRERPRAERAGSRLLSLCQRGHHRARGTPGSSRGLSDGGGRRRGDRARGGVDADREERAGRGGAARGLTLARRAFSGRRALGLLPAGGQRR